MSSRIKVFIFSVILLAGIGLIGSYQLAWATPDEPEAVSSTWVAPVQITTNANGGKLPAIAVAPNGRSVMVAYIQQMSGDPNDTVAYARESNNNGNSWAAPVAIGTNNSADVSFLDIAYDGSNVAHAVWTDISGQTRNIYYAKETSWPANPTPFSSVSEPGLITTPAIAIRGNQIYIVWAEDNVGTGLTEIYYRYSSNGGNSWSANTAVATLSYVSLKPDISFGADGKAHLVWQYGLPPLPTIQVMYSQRTGTGAWSTPIPISNVSSPIQPLTPQIVLDGNTAHVSYTNWENLSPTSLHDEQYVHHIQCASGCTNQAGWQGTSNPVSGQQLSENNNNPFTVQSTITQVGGCTLVYFHGIPDGLLNEQIFGVSSCKRWSASQRDIVTPSNLASINPDMASHNDWFVYIAYENLTSQGNRSVWFIKNDPAVYLPLIRKP